MSSKLQPCASKISWHFPDEDEKLLPQGQKRVNGNSLQIRNEMSSLLISDKNIDPGTTQLQFDRVTDRYKSETERIHNSLAQRDIEKIDFSSPFYQNLDMAMAGINAIGNVIGAVEKEVGKVVSAACDNPVTTGLCTVVSLSAKNIGKAIVYATPDVVKSGASALATHLENNGVSKENIQEIRPNLLKTGSLVTGGVIAKGLKTIPKPKYPLAGRIDTVLQKRNQLAPLSGTELKTTMAKAYRAATRNEQTFLSDLTQVPYLTKPTHFPSHLDDFYAKCNIHSFRLSHLGPLKKGTLEGHILHNDNGLFLIKSTEWNTAILEKIHSATLINSSHLYWDQRLGYILDEIKGVAQAKGLERIYLAWNPEKHAVLTTLRNRSETILSTSTLPTGANSAPLTVVEIAVPK